MEDEKKVRDVIYELRTCTSLALRASLCSKERENRDIKSNASALWVEIGEL
jgi:hypothetical protein